MIHGPVLVIVAHPDDEVLACGGTLAQVWDGLVHDPTIRIVIAATAEVEQTRSDRHRDDLIDDMAAAHSALGLAPPVTALDLPDQQLDTVPVSYLVGLLAPIIAGMKPATVFTHHPDDLNADHRRIAEAVLVATRPAAAAPRAIYACEVPSSTEWAFGSRPFRPNTFVDISATIDRKVAAMEAYRSERRPSPHPRSPEMLRALARIRGAAAGFEYAEAFTLLRHLL
jgi:LmbE family N-acetylglucosaminyl deacetylase